MCTKVNINKCVYDNHGCWRWTQINRSGIEQGQLETGKDTGSAYGSEFMSFHDLKNLQQQNFYSEGKKS